MIHRDSMAARILLDARLRGEGKSAVQALRDEGGQTLIFAALCFSILLGFVGLAVDVGLMFNARRLMQAAADSAAIAGAEEVNYGDVTAAARADAALNGVTNGANSAVVAVNNPPLSGPHSGNTGYVEVIVSESQATVFMSVLGQGSMTVSGRAVAALGITQNCVYAMKTSGTDITLSGGVNVQSAGCAFYADSSSSADLTIQGNSTLKAQGINLVGGYTNSSSTLTPTPTVGIAPVSDPLAFLPAPTFNTSSCVANPNLGGGGTFTIGPATPTGTICYNGLQIGNGATVTFRPGMYIINGAMTVNGGSPVTGAGVSFYFPVGGSLSFSNGASFNFTAPTSGTYNGILFYQNRSNSTTATIEGGTSSAFSGILYFPGANLSISGGSSTSMYASIVSGSLTFSGGITLRNYALVNSSTPLSSSRLVE